MATLQQYAQNIWDRQKIIARKSGVDISQTEKEARVFNKSMIVIVAAIVKTLVDKGVITDAELLATLNQARDENYIDEPTQPQPPDPL